IDVTGTDLEAVNGCLAILSTALAERGGRIQTVKTKYPDRTLETPDLTHRPHSLDLRRAHELLGLSLKPAAAVEGLRRDRPAARGSPDPPVLAAAVADEHLPVEQAPRTPSARVRNLGGRSPGAERTAHRGGRTPSQSVVHGGEVAGPEPHAGRRSDRKCRRR